MDAIVQEQALAVLTEAAEDLWHAAHTMMALPSHESASTLVVMALARLLHAVHTAEEHGLLDADEIACVMVEMETPSSGP